MLTRLQAKQTRYEKFLRRSGAPSRSAAPQAPYAGTFADFIRACRPGYVFYDHLLPLVDLLQRVERGEVTRAAVFMPPRHGKSETVSRLFPAYLLRRHADRFVGVCSYSAALAYTFSRAARDNYERSSGALRADAQAVTHWETGLGGGLWAAGVGGPITGKGYHTGIIDDPLKNAQDAASATIRDRQWDWYQSTFTTREEPTGAQVLTLTRWHEDDLAGRILAQAADEGERWTILVMEAVKTSDPLPDVFAEHDVIEDRRADGDALCPPRYDAGKLAKLQSRVGPYFWSALYQQRPSAPEGHLWQRAWFEPFDTLPEDTQADGFDWDTAYTTNEQNSAWAYVRSCRDAEGTIYITDFDFRWLETPEGIAWMRALLGPHFIEAKASGKSAAPMLRREGITAVEVQVPGGTDKIARVVDASPVAAAGRVKVKRSLLARLLDDPRQGILRFPNGSHADVSDVLAQAIARHAAPRRRRFGALASPRS